MSFTDSILLNGYAELGNMSGWEYSGASVVNDPVYGGRHFLLSSGGYMMQKLPLTAIAKTAAKYLFIIHYYRTTDEILMDPTQQTYCEILLRYEEGMEDVHTFPFQGQPHRFNIVEVEIDIPEGAQLSDLVVRILNHESFSVRLDNIQLRPSVEYSVPDSGGDYSNFREKSILYGLEEDLPKLGGY